MPRLTSQVKRNLTKALEAQIAAVPILLAHQLASNETPGDRFGWHQKPVITYGGKSNQMRALSFITVVAFLSVPLFGQGPDVHPVTCSSNGAARQVCPAPTRNGVLLRRDLSNGACRQGDTWGYDRHGIFVSGGCSAEFLVRDDHRDGGDAYGRNSYGGNGYIGNDSNNSSNGGYRPPPPPQLAVIPAGTVLQVQLNQRIGPDSASVGETVPATLVNNLVINGVTIAPAGSRVELKVVGDDRSRQYPLSIKLEHLRAAGVGYHFQTNVIHNANESARAQGQQGDRAGLGNVLGAILDPGAAQVLPSGSVFNFQLTQDAAPHPNE